MGLDELFEFVSPERNTVADANRLDEFVTENGFADPFGASTKDRARLRKRKQAGLCCGGVQIFAPSVEGVVPIDRPCED